MGKRYKLPYCLRIPRRMRRAPSSGHAYNSRKRSCFKCRRHFYASSSFIPLRDSLNCSSITARANKDGAAPTFDSPRPRWSTDEDELFCDIAALNESYTPLDGRFRRCTKMANKDGNVQKSIKVRPRAQHQLLATVSAEKYFCARPTTHVCVLYVCVSTCVANHFSKRVRNQRVPTGAGLLDVFFFGEEASKNIYIFALELRLVKFSLSRARAISLTPSCKVAIVVFGGDFGILRATRAHDNNVEQRVLQHSCLVRESWQHCERFDSFF